MMLPILAALFASTHLIVAVADEVPMLDVMPSCRAVQEQDPKALSGCLTDEDNARAALAKSWSQYSPDERARCTSETKSGDLASYVELLTCLELSRQTFTPAPPWKQ